MGKVSCMGRIKRIGIFLILPLVAGFLVCVWMIVGYVARSKVPQQVQENVLSVSKDGTVRLYLVGEFEQSYYGVPELSRMAMDEAAAYNAAYPAAGKTAVTVGKVEKSEKDGRIRVNYTFADAESYVGLNGGVLFYGTVKEAADAGYHLDDVAFTDVKKGSTVLGADIVPSVAAAIVPSVAGRHILITDQKALLYCPYGVTYVAGAVCRGDGVVDAVKAAGKVFVLMKK